MTDPRRFEIKFTPEGQLSEICPSSDVSEPKISYLWFAGKDGWQVTSFDPKDDPAIGVADTRMFIEQSAYEALKAENEKLRAGLADLFKMLDEGILVRNITDDGDRDWALQMLKLVSRLQEAKAALEGGET